MVFPGAALLLTVLAFNLVGDGLLDALNPRENRGERCTRDACCVRLTINRRYTVMRVVRSRSPGGHRAAGRRHHRMRLEQLEQRVRPAAASQRRATSSSLQDPLKAGENPVGQSPHRQASSGGTLNVYSS